MLKCPYCGKDAALVTGDKIYPHRPDLYDRNFWLCAACDAYVGCHKKGAHVRNAGKSDGTLPLGCLANAELRKWRSLVHSILDPLWQTKKLKRRDVYRILAKHLNIRISQCHVGLFNEDRCKQAIKFLNERFPAS